MMSVAEIKEELSKMKTPYVGINPTEEEKQRFFIYMSRREELAEQLKEAEESSGRWEENYHCQACHSNRVFPAYHLHVSGWEL